MRLLRLAERLELLHKLVESEITGSPKQFADRLRISRSSLYDLISELNSMGVDIRYSRKRSSFYYANSKYICIIIKIKCKIN